MKYITTRDVNSDETYGHPMPKGSVVYDCTQSSYGCCDMMIETPVTFDPDGGYPFFGMPLDAIEETP